MQELQSYFSFSSLQFGFSTPAQISFTPESPRVFLDRFRSLRCEFDFKAEVRASQASSVTPQPLNLQRTTTTHSLLSHNTLNSSAE